jgi:hypothetical protein
VDRLELQLYKVEAFNMLTKVRMDALKLQVTNAVSFQARARESFQVVDNCLSRHHSDIRRTNHAVNKMVDKFDLNTETLVGNMLTIEGKILLMVDKLCHCATREVSVVQSGGSRFSV